MLVSPVAHSYIDTRVPALGGGGLLWIHLMTLKPFCAVTIVTPGIQVIRCSSGTLPSNFPSSATVSGLNSAA